MLTKEQIEEWREVWRRVYGESSPLMQDINALCDLALRGIEDRRDAERMRDAVCAAWYATGQDIRGGEISAFMAAIDRAMAEGRDGK